uniref:Uncharacterized protein n=1 Tax=Arundo donax TaxID=35708 RepID=A0A0A9H030_ARUDO
MEVFSMTNIFISILLSQSTYYLYTDDQNLKILTNTYPKTSYFCSRREYLLIWKANDH